MGGGPIIGPCTTFGVITARLPPFRRGGVSNVSGICLRRMSLKKAITFLSSSGVRYKYRVEYWVPNITLVWGSGVFMYTSIGRHFLISRVTSRPSRERGGFTSHG